MKVSPLELQRLVFRIEQLQRTSTSGWIAADEMTFRSRLPGWRSLFALPDPKWLREQVEVDVANWQMWLRTVLDCERLVSRNRPGSMPRLIHDLRRGKVPYPR